MTHKKALRALYQRLYHAYGPQHWWPADSAFEIMVGAILTQNTAWTNVTRAIQNLQAANALDQNVIMKMTEQKLAILIRPAGYFNVKARRLKNYVRWFVGEGGFGKLNRLRDETLRESLLSVNGVGPETADDILLYAFARPVFVIDVYTRRLLLRLNLITGDESYEDLQWMFETVLPKDVEQFKEYHALIVRHAKQKCDRQADCVHCHVENGGAEVDKIPSGG